MSATSDSNPSSSNNSTQHTRRSRFNIYIAIAVVALIGIACSGIGLISELTLSQNGVTTMATVTDTEMSYTNGNPTYDVQYEFSINGQVYTCSDPTGRRDLWCGVSYSEYQSADATQQIQVLYLPDNPWNNRPADKSPDTPIFIVIIVSLLVFLIPALIINHNQSKS